MTDEARVEAGLELLWKQQKGVDPDTGLMWLTPQMSRDVIRIEKAWADEHNEHE